MHLKPLTSLRFLFALMVFVSHLNFLKNSNHIWLRDTYNTILSQGYIGVSFFFILSGFILTHVYRFKLDSNATARRSFFIARLARVYPLHLATFLIAIPLMFWGQEITIRGLLLGLSNVTLTQSFIPIKELYFSFNGPSWSISCEAFFYLCFPYLLILFNKLGKFKYYLTAILASIIIILTNYISPNLQHGLFYINPLFRIVDFILGIVIYDLYINLKNQKTLVDFTILEFLSIAIFVLFFSLRDSVTDTSLYSIFYWIPIMTIILIFAFQQGAISKILSHKYAIWLGEISFGFYMIHHLVMRYFILGNGKFELITNHYLIIILLFTVTVIAAAASHRYFETPLNRWIRNKN